MSIATATGLVPDVSPSAFNTFAMTPATAIWFDDRLFERAKEIAKYLAQAVGFVPEHLIGKPAACFAVVDRSLNWRLSPYAVAACTYITPGGKIGFEGKLCQAILENSGRLVGGVEYDYFHNVILSIPVKGGEPKRVMLRTDNSEYQKAIDDGATIIEEHDWGQIQGKFREVVSAKGKKYAAPDWKPEDEVGLGVIVSAQVKGEAKPRRLKVKLVQAWPRNSTLWALDPQTQLSYLAVRRFANLATPGIFMGVPFEGDITDPALSAQDVTPPPKPLRSDFKMDGVKGDASDRQPTDAEQAEADRMAAEFARTGGQQQDDTEGSEDGEDGGDQASDAAQEQDTEQQSNAEPEPETVEFWKRESLEIVPVAVGKSHDWNAWQPEIMRRIAEAASLPDLDALERMNVDHISLLSLKYRVNGEEVKNAFNARRAFLSQGGA